MKAIEIISETSVTPEPQMPWVLLKQWVQSRSQAAFGSIVQHYAPLVWGVAFRKTGNIGMAEEACQQVFTDLASKAQLLLRLRPPLAAWLHRVAVFEAIQVLRREISHRKRIQALAEDQVIGKPMPEKDPWEEIRPQLDHAINALSEADRQVLMLHWFEKRGYAEIARELGCTPEAAQRRGSRVVDKLGKMLRSKKPVLAGGVLATGLTAELSPAMPIGLAGKLTLSTAGTLAQAVSTSSIVLHQSLTSMASAKLTTAAVVLLSAALPISVSWNTIAAARSVAAASKNVPPGHNADGAKTAPQQLSGPGAASELDLSLIKLALQRLAANPLDYEASLELRRIIFSLSEPEVAAVLKLMLGLNEKQRDALHKEAECLFARWAELNPAAANESALALSRKKFGFAPTHGAFTTWAAADLDAAWAWLMKSTTDPAVLQFVGGGALAKVVIYQMKGAEVMKRVEAMSDKNLVETLRYWVVRAWAYQNADASIQWATSLPEEAQRNEWVAKTLELVGDTDARKAMQHLEKVEMPDKRGEVAHNILWPHLLQKPKETFNLLKRHTTDWPEDLFRDAGDALSRHDLAHATESALALPEGPARQEFVKGMLTGSAYSDDVAAALPALALVPLDDLIGHLNQFINRLLSQNPKAAVQWIDGMPSGSFLRESSTAEFQGRFQQTPAQFLAK